MRARKSIMAAAMATAILLLPACGTCDKECDEMAGLVDKYTSVTLTADLDRLSEKERQMIPILIEACQVMDEVFWLQAYGDREQLLGSIEDPGLRKFAEINYGPWDRLDENKPFLDGVGPKPKGAGFYPSDMTEEEFEAACEESPEKKAALKSLYTIVKRDEQGGLYAVPFHQEYPEQTARAASLLRQAAELAEGDGLRTYLESRAVALESDDYYESDKAWLDMKDNGLDVVIGPIEYYEDEIFGGKASHEGFVLIKDRDWSRRLGRYASLLPELQKGLPVDDEYKKEMPGTDSDLNAYDVVYYAGHCNAGSKTIAINLPNDEKVQAEKGSRRLQLKNAMRAKFDKILLPIADVLIAPDQRRNIKFESFFANVMFHEVAHGLGISNTINDRGTVREAMKDRAGALEEAKADILGLYLVTKLHEMGELNDADLEDNYVTFLAGLFRSIRFGAASAHGKANLAEFRFLREAGAFHRDEGTGTYSIDFEKMQAAVATMARKILILQGNGDYDGAGEFLFVEGAEDTVLFSDLDSLKSRKIPVDIVFEQGVQVLGLAG